MTPGDLVLAKSDVVVMVAPTIVCHANESISWNVNEQSKIIDEATPCVLISIINRFMSPGRREKLAYVLAPDAMGWDYLEFYVEPSDD